VTDGDPVRLGRLMDGYLSTQLLYVAARLGIADALAGGPCSAAELAGTVGAEPGALRRVLRGLAVDEVVSEVGQGRFALTPAGELLRAGVPGSLRDAVLVRGELYVAAAAGLLDAVRAGGTAFEYVYGRRFFAHLDDNAEHEAAFAASMADRAEYEAADVVATYDFGGIERLVDVGGGTGTLLAAILAAAPGLRGTVLDRPAAVAAARTRLGERGTAVAGDFFAAVPAGADAYLLSRVLHDWSDAECGRILAACRDAMPAGGRLLVVEAILPERARDRPAAIRMDLHMLMLLGSRERTEAEFRTLLGTAGFTVTRVLPTGSPTGLGIVEAVPAT
jgi:O-methyltransferase domain/Dimerisation domain